MDNPYAPPAKIDQTSEPDSDARKKRRRFPLLLWMAAVVYGAFAVSLVTRQMGFGDLPLAGLFLVNAALVGVASVVASLDNTFADTAASVGIVGQLVILTIMLVFGIGGVIAIVSFNLVFITVFGGLAGYYAMRNRMAA